MRPERTLGRDPVPGDLRAVDDVAGILRECVLTLAEGRRRLDRVLGPESMWKGAHAAVVVQSLSAFSMRLRALEDAVAEFAQAWQAWRAVVERGKDRSAELVEAMLAGADERRDAVLAHADTLAEEHLAAASTAAAAAETLVDAARTERDETVLADGLGRALGALHAAIGQWVRDAGEQLDRATASVETVVELTAVVPTLIGLGSASADATAKAAGIAGRAPGSHRLQRALARSWPPPDLEDLPEASFAGERTTSLGERLRGGDR